MPQTSVSGTSPSAAADVVALLSYARIEVRKIRGHCRGFPRIARRSNREYSGDTRCRAYSRHYAEFPKTHLELLLPQRRIRANIRLRRARANRIMKRDRQTAHIWCRRRRPNTSSGLPNAEQVPAASASSTAHDPAETPSTPRASVARPAVPGRLQSFKAGRSHSAVHSDAGYSTSPDSLSAA